MRTNESMCYTIHFYETLYYYGYPSPSSKELADFSSNCPFLETLFMYIPRQYTNLKLSSHSLRTLVLHHSPGDLHDIDINASKLLLFKYHGHYSSPLDKPNPMVRDSTESKARMEDTLWFKKLMRFLDKNNDFRVLKLHIVLEHLMDVEELKAIMWLPFELEHHEPHKDLHMRS